MTDTFHLFVLGWVDLAIIATAMIIFVAPFTCASKWYPNEPVPKITQYGTPSVTRMPLSLFVNNTVIRPDWYVSSISEFGGARGSTASKMLTLATTSASCFQFALALCIYQQEEYEYLARFILLSIGSFAGLMIGMAESALLWKYGREQQIRLLWNIMNKNTRLSELSNTLLALDEMNTYLTSKSVDSRNNLVAHAFWADLQFKRVGHATVVNTPTQAFLTTHPRNLTDAVTPDLKGCFSHEEILQYRTELDAILFTQTVPDMPPNAYIKFKQFQTDIDELTISGASGTDPEIILQNDAAEKGVYSTIHMISAMLLIFCNFAAHMSSKSTLAEHPARYGSFISSIVGVTAFIIFCLMQYVSGNYDDSFPTWLSTSNCLPSLQCPQTDPSKYQGRNKKCLALCFMSIEIVAFLSIIVSVPIESIMMRYN